MSIEEIMNTRYDGFFTSNPSASKPRICVIDTGPLPVGGVCGSAKLNTPSSSPAVIVR